MGANHNQYLNAIKEAEAHDGPSLIIAYAPCINHGIKGGMGKSQLTEKEAVECGYWHLWRFNPALETQGKNPFSLDSKEPDWSKFQQFIHSEVRYTSLLKSFPDEAKRAVRRFGKERAVALRDLQALRRNGLLGYGRGEVVRTTILFLPGRVRKRRAPVSFPAEETVSPDSRRSRSRRPTRQPVFLPYNRFRRPRAFSGSVFSTRIILQHKNFESQRDTTGSSGPEVRSGRPPDGIPVLPNRPKDRRPAPSGIFLSVHCTSRLKDIYLWNRIDPNAYSLPVPYDPDIHTFRYPDS